MKKHVITVSAESYTVATADDSIAVEWPEGSFQLTTEPAEPPVEPPVEPEPPEPPLPEVPADAIYVAPNGDDTTGDGTEAKPYKTLPKLNGLLSPGDTVLMRGGTYDVAAATGWFWTSSGIAGNLIRIHAYPGEKPVIDLSNCTAARNKYFGSTHAGGNGLQCSNVSYTHWRGIHVRRAPMDGVCFYGDKGSGCQGNILEQMTASENGRNGEVGNGFAIYRLGNGYRVKNCDSWGNKNSVGNGDNADGFQFSTTGGDDNIASGLRAWNNGDDGYDLIQLWDNTTQGKWVIEYCWAWRNGYQINGTTETSGDGNGFKLGGAPGTGRVNASHLAKNCLSWSNKVDGFQDNDANRPLTVQNCTAWDNNRTNLTPTYYGNFNFEGTRARSVLRNNVSAMPKYGKHANVKNTDTQFNSWDTALSVNVSAADFISLDDSIAKGSRNPDGSLPASDFLRLASGSDLIDKGTDVGIPFNGAAPDLGAYETGQAGV